MPEILYKPFDRDQFTACVTSNSAYALQFLYLYLQDVFPEFPGSAIGKEETREGRPGFYPVTNGVPFLTGKISKLNDNLLLSQFFTAQPDYHRWATASMKIYKVKYPIGNSDTSAHIVTCPACKRDHIYLAPLGFHDTQRLCMFCIRTLKPIH